MLRNHAVIRLGSAAKEVMFITSEIVMKFGSKVEHSDRSGIQASSSYLLIALLGN
jgi:hypothetical protein